jgi:8-oxo-dGTP diphosphatase
MPPLPHRIATLLYCFNPADEVLLLRRAKPPNQGLWSPPGGKLEIGSGESPHSCAAREASEELGILCRPSDFHLTGIVAEQGYEGTAHWLMFLFELRTRLDALPKPHEEGEFRFCRREELDTMAMPRTDRERIWPLFWSHRGGFFAAQCRCSPGLPDVWELEESWKGSRG